MTTSADREHLAKIRDRFTNTAEPFSQFVLSRRTVEADRLAIMATANFPDAALSMDLACGPGTFAHSLAARLKHVIGVDFTPAMLMQAGKAAARAGRTNFALVCADANALPFADGTFDVATCGYALHHLLAPDRVVREMARVVRAGGRVAIVDMLVPEGADGNALDRIERVRDPSHATALSGVKLRGLLADTGLQVRATEESERLRDFDQWMHVAGSEPGSPIYAETRKLLEASIPNDATGFRPRIDPATGSLQITQKTLFLVAEKA